MNRIGVSKRWLACAAMVGGGLAWRRVQWRRKIHDIHDVVRAAGGLIRSRTVRYFAGPTANDAAGGPLLSTSQVAGYLLL